MSYEVEHLTKLGALKSLAEKVKEQLGGYAKTTAIADMQTFAMSETSSTSYPRDCPLPPT